MSQTGRMTYVGQYNKGTVRVVPGIYLIDKDDNLVELKEQPYEDEARLQELLARYPSLLAGDQMEGVEPRKWLLVARDGRPRPARMGLTVGPSITYFQIRMGSPTIVEVKRSSDTRIRREVVGQMLDYAAERTGSIGRSISLRARFEQTCESQEPRQDRQRYSRTLFRSTGAAKPVSLHFGCGKTNLQAGRVRMIFVADVNFRSNSARIVEFLIFQMDPAGSSVERSNQQFTNDTL